MGAWNRIFWKTVARKRPNSSHGLSGYFSTRQFENTQKALGRWLGKGLCAPKTFLQRCSLAVFSRLYTKGVPGFLGPSSKPAPNSLICDTDDGAVIVIMSFFDSSGISKCEKFMKNGGKVCLFLCPGNHSSLLMLLEIRCILQL